MPLSGQAILPAAAVQTAIAALSSVGAGNVVVTGSVGAYQIKYVNAMADTPETGTVASALTGGNGDDVLELIWSDPARLPLDAMFPADREFASRLPALLL